MRKAFTLLEVIVVITIFSIVSLVSVNTFLTTFRVSQQTNIENSILEDARFIMAQISNAVESNTIDYEEYFSHCVASEDCPNLFYSFDTSKPDNWDPGVYVDFGKNYGLYNWQFFYGGVTDLALANHYHGFGTVCQDADSNELEYPNDDCVTGPLTYSEDLDTGVNPNNVRRSLDFDYSANAFCTDDQYQLFNQDGTNIDLEDSEWGCTTVIDGRDEFVPLGIGKQMMDELYLIDEDSEKKTILALETVSASGDRALAKVEMDKFAQAQKSAEVSMPLFAFTCAQRYDCSIEDSDSIDSHGNYTSSAPMSVPLRYDPYIYNPGENIYDDFVPISPLRVNIKSLKFLITPLEDPRRSFDESDDATKVQPSVTVFVELEPSSEFKSPFLSKNFNLKLQTTVTSGIIDEVPIVSDSE